jgi:hypothetical protein
MVSTTQAINPQTQPTGSSRIHTITRAIADYFDSAGQALKAAHEYERLSALSDQQLAARGLSRQTLTQHVFADYLRH